MADEKSLPYWKARAEALEAANRRLHERLTAMATVLPPELLDLLDGVPDAPSRTARTPLGPTENGSELTPSDVETELSRLWKKKAPPASG